MIWVVSCTHLGKVCPFLKFTWRFLTIIQEDGLLLHLMPDTFWHYHNDCKWTIQYWLCCFIMVVVSAGDTVDNVMNIVDVWCSAHKNVRATCSWYLTIFKHYFWSRRNHFTTVLHQSCHENCFACLKIPFRTKWHQLFLFPYKEVSKLIMLSSFSCLKSIY